MCPHTKSFCIRPFNSLIGGFAHSGNQEQYQDSIFLSVSYFSNLCGLIFQAPTGSNKIVGVFYKAHEYASLSPNFLGCVENALGIREWLESNGHQYIVTDDKEGPDCGEFGHANDFFCYLVSTSEK